MQQFIKKSSAKCKYFIDSKYGYIIKLTYLFVNNFVFLFSISTDILYRIAHKIESIKISQIKLYYALKIIYLGFIQSIPKLSCIIFLKEYNRKTN